MDSKPRWVTSIRCFRGKNVKLTRLIQGGLGLQDNSSKALADIVDDLRSKFQSAEYCVTYVPSSPTKGECPNMDSLVNELETSLYQDLFF